MSIRQDVSNRLDAYRPDDNQLHPVQLAIAAYAFVLFALASAMGNLAIKAAKQAAALAKTLAVLVLVYATYYAVAEMVDRPVRYAINRIVDEASSRGDLSERAENLLGLAISLAIAYATYRLVKWATLGTAEALGAPNPEQTSVSEYLDEDDDEPLEADVNPDHPLHESNQ